MTVEGNREERRAARKEGKLDTAAFLKVADGFIDLANRQNQKVLATEPAYGLSVCRCQIQRTCGQECPWKLKIRKSSSTT